MPYACVTDQVTDLPVCDIDPAALVPLHEALGVASDYLYTYHLAPTARYKYRRDYLPEKITGNDVVALSRLAQEMSARGLTVPPELSYFLPVGDPSVRDYVTGPQVEYTASAAPTLTPAVEAALTAIQAYDESQNVSGDARWIFAVAIGVVVATGTAAALSKRG